MTRLDRGTELLLDGLTFDAERHRHPVDPVLVLDGEKVPPAVLGAHAPDDEPADVAVLPVGVLHQLLGQVPAAEAAPGRQHDAAPLPGVFDRQRVAAQLSLEPHVAPRDGHHLAGAPHHLGRPGHLDLDGQALDPLVLAADHVDGLADVLALVLVGHVVDPEVGLEAPLSNLPKVVNLEGICFFKSRSVPKRLL